MTATKRSILIVEDNVAVHEIIVPSLESEFTVDTAVTGLECLKKIEANKYALVILDVILPDIDGYQLCSRIRNLKTAKNTPVIFLTSKDKEADKLKGFDLGGDDYLTKPFSPAELRARVGAVLRRSCPAEPPTSVAKGNLEINNSSQRAFNIEGNSKKEIELTHIEFKILKYFFEHEDHMFSRAQIIDAIWGNETHITERTVDTHISKLRRKLGPLGDYFESVHGAGYRFKT